MQQDAHEFLNYLLNTVADILQEEKKQEKQNGRLKNNGTAVAAGDNEVENKVEPTWVHDIFQGTLTNETRCLNCETVLFLLSLTLSFFRSVVPLRPRRCCWICVRLKRRSGGLASRRGAERWSWQAFECTAGGLGTPSARQQLVLEVRGPGSDPDWPRHQRGSQRLHSVYVRARVARSHVSAFFWQVSSKDEDFLDLSVDVEQNTSITHCLRLAPPYCDSTDTFQIALLFFIFQKETRCISI